MAGSHATWSQMAGNQEEAAPIIPQLAVQKADLEWKDRKCVEFLWSGPKELQRRINEKSSQHCLQRRKRERDWYHPGTLLKRHRGVKVRGEAVKIMSTLAIQWTPLI